MRFFLVSVFLILLGAVGSASTPILYNVPLVRQSTSYSCGAAALQSVMAYYGNEFMESEIIEEVHTDPKKGTEIEDMVAFANDNGVVATARNDVTLEELAAAVKAGNPPIVSFQAWPDKPIPVDQYVNTWAEGHYAVVIGMSDQSIYFMDPSMLGSHGYISRSDFLKRWHDLGSKSEKLQHPAIFFTGTPKPPSAWALIP